LLSRLQELVRHARPNAAQVDGVVEIHAAYCADDNVLPLDGISQIVEIRGVAINNIHAAAFEMLEATCATQEQG
jgi:hypothetical protein